MPPQARTRHPTHGGWIRWTVWPRRPVRLVTNSDSIRIGGFRGRRCVLRRSRRPLYGRSSLGVRASVRESAA